MKKRNKKFNPNKHSVNRNSAFEAINLVKPVCEDSKERLALDAYAALDAFTKRVAKKAHFDVLDSTVDLAMMLSQNIFNNDYMDEINAAREGMIRCKDRFIRMGALGFDGEGYNAVKFAIELYGEQLNHVTGAEVVKFMKARENHIRSGNFYRGAPAERERMAA